MTCQRNDWTTHLRGRVRGVQVPGDSLEELLPAVLELRHVRRVTVMGDLDHEQYEAFEARLAEERPEVSLQILPTELLFIFVSEP